MNRAGRRDGYTLLEVMVASTILVAGAAGLWYEVEASARVDALNRLRHAANEVARNELESLRRLPRDAVRDTGYAVAGAAGRTMVVERRVFDSARVAAAFPEVELDADFGLKALHQNPVEVRVRVWEARPGAGGAPGEPDTSAPPLSDLSLKLPEWRWY